MEKIKSLGNSRDVVITDLIDVQIKAYIINKDIGTYYMLCRYHNTTPTYFRIYDAKGNLDTDYAENSILKYLEVCPLSNTTYYFYNNTFLGEYILYNQSGDVLLSASEGNTITANKNENGKTDFILCITSDDCPPYTLTINSSSFKSFGSPKQNFPIKSQYLERYIISGRPFYFYNNTKDGKYAIYDENTKEMLSASTDPTRQTGQTITVETNADGELVFMHIINGVKWPHKPVITKSGRQDFDLRSPHND